MQIGVLAFQRPFHIIQMSSHQSFTIYLVIYDYKLFFELSNILLEIHLLLTSVKYDMDFKYLWMSHYRNNCEHCDLKYTWITAGNIVEAAVIKKNTLWPIRLKNSTALCYLKRKSTVECRDGNNCMCMSKYELIISIVFESIVLNFIFLIICLAEGA